MTSLDIYRLEVKNLTIDIDEKTVLRKKLMQKDTVSCETISNTVLDIAIGDYITYDGENYTINRLPDVEKINFNTFKYSITFDSDFAILGKKLFISTDGLAEFPYNGTAEDFVDLLLTNINSIYPTWTKGTITATDYVTLEFSNEYCDEVLIRIAEYFKLEFIISAKEITMIPAVGTTTALTFEYGRGKGLYKLTRQQVQDQNILTRVFGYGGSKNIDYTYRSGKKKLIFDNSGVAYLEKNVATYGVIEGQFTDENVFPQRTGTITSTDINFLGTAPYLFDENTSYIVDSAMDFDLNDYLLEGQTAKIVFKTGDLAGLTCEIWKYVAASKRFYIKLYLDPEDDYPYPNYNGGTPIEPKVGDTYTLVDITMPQSYIDTAEAELKSRTQAFIDQNSVPQVVYLIDIDPRYAMSIDAFSVGDKVTIKDTDLAIDNLIRISEIEFPLVEPYKRKATIADFVPYTLPERIVKTIVEEKKETKYANIRQHRDARLATSQQKQLKDLIFDTDNYFDNDNIRPLSIETMYLAVGTKSSNFNLENVVIQCNYGGDANAVHISGGNLAHLEIDIFGLGSIWVIGSAYTVSGLTPATAYYLYAKCSESALTGEWVLSSSKITVQQVAGYYHFYVGNLFAVASGRRDFDFVKGMTYIVGDTIKSGKIQDLTGNNYFDLTNGKFKIGNAASSLDYNVTNANTLTLKGALVQSSSGTFPVIRFCGAYASGTTYEKGDQVTYNGTSWNYINATPKAGETPTEGAYWTAAALAGTDGTNGTDGADGADGTDGASSRAVNLSSTHLAIAYNTNGAIPSPTSYTVTATPRNTTGTVYYEFFLGGASQGVTTTNALTINAATLYSSMPQIVEVKIREGAAGNPILATDQITVVGVKAGTDSITVMLTNSAHVCPVEDDVIDYTSSGTDILVWEGVTQLTPDTTNPYANSTFRVIDVTVSNITAGSASVAGNAIRYGVASALSANVATITFTVAVKNAAGVEANYTLIQSIAKSVQGATGSTGASGPAVVPRGDFAANTIYFNSAERRDVVYYGGVPYIFKGTTGASGWNEDNWETFGGAFDSAYIDFLFSKSAYIGNLTVGSVATSQETNIKRVTILDNILSIFGGYGGLKYTITGGSLDGATVDDTFDIVALNNTYDFGASGNANWGESPTGFPASGVLATFDITNENNEVHFPAMDFAASVVKISGTLSTYYGYEVAIKLDDEYIYRKQLGFGIIGLDNIVEYTIPAFVRNLSVGTHNLTFKITYNMSSGASPCVLRTYINNGGAKADNDIIYPQSSILAEDGVLFRKSATEYFFCDFRNSAQFTMRSGNYGLRVESTGITYTANGTDYTSLI